MNKDCNLVTIVCTLQITPKGGGAATGDMYQIMQQKMAHSSRPGSAYVINMNTAGANSEANKVHYYYCRP